MLRTHAERGRAAPISELRSKAPGKGGAEGPRSRGQARLTEGSLSAKARLFLLSAEIQRQRAYGTFEGIKGR